MIEEIKENNICKYMYSSNILNYNNSKKIAMFDLDDTIIKFTKFDDDKFEYKYINIIEKLVELNKEYHLIIISNQLNLLKNKNHRYENWKIKIKSLFEDFTKNKLQIELYASVTDDIYRKPRWGIYNIIFDKYKIKPEFYCGDALGRQGDFSDTDLKFALNCNIKVKSPENIFLHENSKKINISYPKLNNNINNQIFNKITIPKEKEMIILVGMPASGKSYISAEIQSKGFIENKLYMIINRDKLKTIEKCIKYCESNLKLNLSVIIDNTNPSITDRKKFIDLAKKYSYTIRCINFVIPMELALHNNYYRHFKYTTQFTTQLIPKIAYNIFKSKYVNPEIKEGYKEIIEINSILNDDYQYLKYYF
jgi:bifunctional polynucleotide phosphatase/kinase